MRRALPAVVGVALAIAAVAAVFLLATGRDDSQLAGPQGPGELQPNRGAGHSGPAEPSGDDPPTSGTHEPRLVTRDRRAITDDQLIHALELGDVVILYDGREPPAALVQLQQDVMGGPFDAEVAAAGQAVILARRAGAGPATALAWRRILRSDDPSDPDLREFAEFWLGRGLQP
ncbi:MAG TPA: DUF3105 domain-containing protein [Solirubrobacteraceae bacterium]|nr:DUF3105 domain-containing protein [Solirubrobacteraceae bacterium]